MNCLLTKLIYHNVLIVAKCNVNKGIPKAENSGRKVLIVAKCNVNIIQR